MKQAILLSLVSVLSAGVFVGCSNEVQNPHQTCWCPTDGIASFGQDVYYGRFVPCWADGHAVPVTYRTPCDYGYSTEASTSVNTSVTVSGSMGH